MAPWYVTRTSLPPELWISGVYIKAIRARCCALALSGRSSKLFMHAASMASLLVPQGGTRAIAQVPRRMPMDVS